jgi:hypothetical protein
VSFDFGTGILLNGFFDTDFTDAPRNPFQRTPIPKSHVSIRIRLEGTGAFPTLGIEDFNKSVNSAQK